MRIPGIRAIHKWISLSFLCLWILQAASGLAIGYRADIDDFFLGQSARETDATAMAASIKKLQAAGDEISSVWISGGRKGQYDIYLERGGEDRTVRIDGAGTQLRDRSDTNRFSDGAVFETLTRFHKSLMLGSVGYVFLMVSGLLLASNIILGVVMGWPKRQRLTAFARTSGAPKAARLSGWHWRIGFWGAIPAVCIILTGSALTQSDILADWLGVEEQTPELFAPASAPSASLETAIEAALVEFPGASLVAINLPTEDRPWYKFRLNAPGEMPRLYGATRVFVGVDGAILLDHDARKSAPNERIVEALYPLHTGQIGGSIGRMVNTATGIWLLVMIALGLKLWLARRQQRRPATSPVVNDDQPRT